MCYIKNLFIKNNIESNSQFILKFLDVVVSAPKPILPIVKEDFENYNLNDIIKSYIDELVINVATNIGTDCCSSVVSVVYSPENIRKLLLTVIELQMMSPKKREVLCKSCMNYYI